MVVEGQMEQPSFPPTHVQCLETAFCHVEKYSSFSTSEHIF